MVASLGKGHYKSKTQVEKASLKGFPLRGSCQARNQVGQRNQVHSRLTDEVMLASIKTAWLLSNKSPHSSRAKLLNSYDAIGSARPTFPSRGRL